jgi:transposase
MGDREFFFNDFCAFLERYELNYLIRIKRDAKINDTQNVQDIYKKLETEQVSEIIKDNQKIIIKKLKKIKDRRDDCLAVITSHTMETAEKLFDFYRKRWSIERVFFNLESNGWNLMKTHIKKSVRLEMLCYILSLCYFLSEIAGKMCFFIKKYNDKKHGYKPLSFFLLGRRVVYAYLNKKISYNVNNTRFSEIFTLAEILSLILSDINVFYDTISKAGVM